MENTAGVPGSDAREKVNVPAILLMVTGGIGVAFALLGLVQAITGAGANQAQMEALLSNPDVPEWLKSAAATSSRGGSFTSLIQLVLSGLTFFGGLKMKNLESFGLAMAASIIALIPCFGPCCCIGLPVGIWSLIVLNKPEVKSAFR